MTARNRVRLLHMNVVLTFFCCVYQIVSEMIRTTESPDKCLPVFENKNPGWISRQATIVPNEKTEDSCMGTCFRTSTCVSYQIEKNVGGRPINCWHQYSEQKLIKEDMDQSDAINEYVLVNKCQISTEKAEKDVSSECYVTMKPSLFGQLSANATLHESANEERACVAACIAKTDCISVQFKSLDKKWLCSLQFNYQAFKPENLMYHPNVTEYVITKRCNENNPCSRGFPLRRLGGTMYFRKRRGIDAEYEENINPKHKYCEVIIKRVNSGLSTTNTVPIKSELTESDCIAACVADNSCISSQFQRHPSNESFTCSLQHDIKAFEPTKLLNQPNVKEYAISKRCNEKYRCPVGH